MSCNYSHEDTSMLIFASAHKIVYLCKRNYLWRILTIFPCCRVTNHHDSCTIIPKILRLLFIVQGYLFSNSDRTRMLIILFICKYSTILIFFNINMTCCEPHERRNPMKLISYSCLATKHLVNLT